MAVCDDSSSCRLSAYDELEISGVAGAAAGSLWLVTGVSTLTGVPWAESAGAFLVFGGAVWVFLRLFGR